MVTHTYCLTNRPSFVSPTQRLLLKYYTVINVYESTMYVAAGYYIQGQAKDLTHGSVHQPGRCSWFKAGSTP